MRDCRYSYWLFWKISFKFNVQKYSDTCYQKGHCGRSILKNANPKLFLCLMSRASSGRILRQSIKFSYPINLFKEGPLAQNRSRFFPLFKICKHLTPLAGPHVNTMDTFAADSQQKYERSSETSGADLDLHHQTSSISPKEQLRVEMRSLRFVTAVIILA